MTGDVCGAIVGLMYKYNAFPILENDVRNLESGSKQLSLVYKAVNTKFLYSNIDMQNSTRKSWWFNADKWETDYLIETTQEFAKNIKKAQHIGDKYYKPLYLFPGVGVRAYMTSRICSCCNRNALELLKQEEILDSKKKFEINDNGEVIVGGETLRLYHKPNSHTTVVPGIKSKKTYNSINQRAPWTDPLHAGVYGIKDLRKLVLANMRRAPKSKMSRDTSQSRYFCVFKDCEWHNKEHHADINAAINIGRRFLEGVINSKNIKNLD